VGVEPNQHLPLLHVLSLVDLDGHHAPPELRPEPRALGRLDPPRGDDGADQLASLHERGLHDGGAHAEDDDADDEQKRERDERERHARAASDQASVLTFGSRAHWRVLAASTNPRTSAASSTPGSFRTPPASSSAFAPALAAMAFRCPNASRTKSTASASVASALPLAGVSTTATASKIIEGVPASWPSAGIFFPSESVAPPSFCATIFTAAPAPSAAFFKALISAASEPSWTRI